jgi:hypothetical protein
MFFYTTRVNLREIPVSIPDLMYILLIINYI